MLTTPPGRTRIKLAQMLQAQFPVKGTLALTWKPECLFPATGAYRTNQSLDIWRWEAMAYHILTDGSSIPVMSVGSYYTMSECIKASGFKLCADDEVIPEFG